MLAGCNKEPQTIAVESVSVGPATLSLTEGESGNLTATVAPSNATDKTITWSSSNKQVATVAEGKVTAVKAGTATITATAGGKKGECTVSVSAAKIAVTCVVLDIMEMELPEGETQQLTATIEPADATVKTVTWSTSDDKVATVADGLITAVGVGSATITASADGQEATCTVAVYSLAPKAVLLNINKATRYAKGVVNLRASVYPLTAVNKAVSWNSSNDAVATVSNTGYVTVVGEGEATITVTTQDGGLTDQCVVTVVPTPEGALTNMNEFNYSTSENPIFILENDWNPSIYSCIVTRDNGIVDFNGHTSKYLYMQNNDPEQSVTVRNGIISQRLDGDNGWGYIICKGQVILEEMELYQDSYTEFYTDGHVYNIKGGYYSTITTYRSGEALGDVNIYDGTFDKMWDVNPDAGSNQGEFTLYGGKFAFDPRAYVNPGYNPYAQTKIIIADGYSVKENPGWDKELYPFIVTKD